MDMHKLQRFLKSGDHIKSLFHSFCQHQILKAIFFGIVVAVCLFIVVWLQHATTAKQVVTERQFSYERSNLATLGHNLNDVSLKLAAIQAQLRAQLKQTSQAKPINISKLEADISHVQDVLQQATHTQQAVLAHDIVSSNKAVQSKLNKISQQLNSIQKDNQVIKKLPVSDLPFQVLHIDMIQGEAVVTVSYNHTDFPLMVGDALAGFTLTSADFDRQTCVFQNSHKAEVQIALGALQAGNNHA